VTGVASLAARPGAAIAELSRTPLHPVDGLTDVLGLLDDLTALGRVVDGLARRLDDVSGVRAGELQALVAVAEGAEHPRAVARRTGQVDEAGLATVDQLVRRGLLGRHRHPASPVGAGEASLVHLTEAGRVVLDQADGLQIRVLAALLQQVGDAEAQRLRGTVRTLGRALAAPAPEPVEQPAGG
jgi:DNA-binding MarR family transcriptional regulator